MGIRVKSIIWEQIHRMKFLAGINCILTVFAIDLQIVQANDRLQPISSPRQTLNSSLAQMESAPLKIELILPEKKWTRPTSNEGIQEIPLKVRITNLSNVQIQMPNRKHILQSFFNLSMVDSNNQSMFFLEDSDGAYPHIGDPFSTSEACPIVAPRESIEANWILRLDWRREQVLIYALLVDRNDFLIPAWQFRVSRAGAYKIRLDYSSQIVDFDRCGQKVMKNSSAKQTSRLDNILSNIVEVNIVFGLPQRESQSVHGNRKSLKNKFKDEKS
jgi:hypothetical protein